MESLSKNFAKCPNALTSFCGNKQVSHYMTEYISGIKHHKIQKTVKGHFNFPWHYTADLKVSGLLKGNFKQRIPCEISELEFINK